MSKRLTSKKVYQEVVFLIGPVGAGKSLISSELGKRNNLPVITMDLMRHCSKNSEDILNELDKKYKELEIYKVNIDETQNVAMRFNINRPPEGRSPM